MFLGFFLVAACVDSKVDSGLVDADADGALSTVDCDDGDDSVHPGAEEQCDGLDQDCDGEVDEGVAGTWYADADGDGWGDGEDGVVSCEPTDGRVADATDCDDTDGGVNAGAEEVCDGADNDCDLEVDEGVMSTWYADSDGDGWGDATRTEEACTAPEDHTALEGDCNDGDAAWYPGAAEDCADRNDYNCDGSVGWADADGDGHAACTECDDSDPTVNPDATETCDGEDDDCDGTIDEDAVDAATWYLDADADGHGSTTSLTACSAPAGYAAVDDDCDDTDATAWPGADETCDGVDDDCDGTIDEADAVDASVWYADADSDGYGDAGTVVVACDAPAGYVADDTDCDDGHAAANPGADEWCDGIDSDCDGVADNDAVDANTWYTDADSDAFGDPATAVVGCEGDVFDGTDCDDTRPEVSPVGVELCNGRDDDCNGTIDDGLLSTWYADADSDGWGDSATSVEACDDPAGYVTTSGDCDDTDTAYNPDAEDTCGDPNDYNCDGSGGASGDGDGDGYVACNDCDDADPAVSPDDLEYCDSVDNDCDGAVDESDAVDATTVYVDADGDGHGGTVADTACSVTAGLSAVSDDCDDTDATISPDAAESCNGVDDDCDGDVDEATSSVTWYADADADGYGDASVTTLACTPPAGYVADATDCDDADPAAYPGATDVENDGIDQDCDGLREEGTFTESHAEVELDGTGYDDVSCAGGADLNQDGLDDWAFGSPNGDNYRANYGVAYAYYGSTDGDAALDSSNMTIGGRTCCAVGTAISLNGDLTADGFPDILVGAANPGSAGTAGITSGTSGSGATFASDGTIRGVNRGDSVGWSVAIVGDTNADGDDDFLIGAPGVDTSATAAGGAYLFYGPFSGSEYITTADATVLGDDAGDALGSEVASAGDTDGDGLIDIVLGVPDDDTVATDTGGVWLFLSDFTGTVYAADADAIVLGELAGDFGGTSVAGAGDLDGDGYDDLLVGLPGSSGTGWAAIVPGPVTSGALADATTTFLGEQPGDEAGFSVAGLGDRDGDGVLDVGIGAPGSDLAGIDAGAVYVIFGPATGTVDLSEQLVFTGDTSDRAGTCVANAGDVDADGNDDLLAVGMQSAGPATGWLMLAP